MFKKTIITLMALGFLVLAPLSYAENGIKVGVVDLTQIMRGVPQRDELRNKLTAEFRGRRDSIMVLQKEIESLSEAYERDKDILGNADKEAKQRTILTKTKELKRKQEAYQEDASLRENEEARKLLDDIGDLINEYAKKEQYDLILRRDAAPFYVSDKVNITDSVLEFIKKKMGE